MKKVAIKENPFVGFEQFALSTAETKQVRGGEDAEAGRKARVYCLYMADGSKANLYIYNRETIYDYIDRTNDSKSTIISIVGA